MITRRRLRLAASAKPRWWTFKSSAERDATEQSFSCSSMKSTAQR